MSIPYRPDPPDLQNVRLRIMDAQVDLTRWTAYDFSNDFLTPTDSFSFSLGDEELPARQREALKMGARVRLYVQNVCLCEGYIDSIEVNADKRGGYELRVVGRDRLGQTLDTVADPTFQMKEGATLAEFLRRLFEPFGWTGDSFEIDNTANRLATAGDRGPKLSKAKRRFGAPLKSFVLHQTKPYNHESVFHFASRVAQRFGLWIWASADGEKLIVSKPDFDQEPFFTLRRDRLGNGNVLSGAVRYDMTDQPAIIIADGFSGGGEFGKGRIKSYIVNPLLGMTNEGEKTPEVLALLRRFPDAQEVTMPLASFAFRAANIPFRPMFLHDDESKTQEQLNNFVKREMSLLVRRALSAQYMVEGHGATIDGGFSAWTPDTVVDVRDEAAGLVERMYVLGVHYSKQRGGSGTTTRLELIRLNSIYL